MEATANFWFIWLIYGLAATAFYWLFWRVTDFRRARWVSYSLRALMMALIITPWYANVDGTSLAPALMIVALDAITMGTGATGRALVPLILALLLAEICATLYYFISRRRKKSK